MLSLFKPLKALLEMISRAEPRHDLDEAYLAQAVDIRDLEQRMRNLDQQARGSFDGIRFGLYPR